MSRGKNQLSNPESSSRACHFNHFTMLLFRERGRDTKRDSRELEVERKRDREGARQKKTVSSEGNGSMDK